MACMEHWCTGEGCDYVKFDNCCNPPDVCPECGGKDFMNIFDEEPDRED